MDNAAAEEVDRLYVEHTTKEARQRSCDSAPPSHGLARRYYRPDSPNDVKPEGLMLREVTPGWSIEELQKLTGAPLMSLGRAQEMKFL